MRNRLILVLAGIARTLPEPPSVLVKGSTSSGKSTLLKETVRLFPPDCVVERAGLSAKALAHGFGSLANKILLLNEYKCGKDAELLLRLLQSDGRISHEFTTVRGASRGTQTVERVGTPVVLTTTTDDRVFPDDETRFLSIWVDESPTQTLAIVTAQASGPRAKNEEDLPVWQTAMSLLARKNAEFQDPPVWLRYVAENLPLDKLRVRRDWKRILNFCRAVALCRPSTSGKEAVDITFADYCVAFRILEPALASTVYSLRTQELNLGRAVALLNEQLGRAVTTREIAEKLNWNDALVYKYLKPAVKNQLLKYETGTREKNVKLLWTNTDVTGGFLPSPKSVFQNNPEIGPEVRYVDPFTGKQVIMRAVPKGGDRQARSA